MNYSENMKLIDDKFDNSQEKLDYGISNIKNQKLRELLTKILVIDEDERVEIEELMNDVL